MSPSTTECRLLAERECHPAPSWLHHSTSPCIVTTVLLMATFRPGSAPSALPRIPPPGMLGVPPPIPQHVASIGMPPVMPPMMPFVPLVAPPMPMARHGAAIQGVGREGQADDCSFNTQPHEVVKRLFPQASSSSSIEPMRAAA